MYFDIPEFQRCCGCVPARFGLLVWMYIRLMLSISMLAPFLFLLILFYTYMTFADVIIPILISGLLLVDVIMNVVALVGGHSKNPKLLKVYYSYSLVAILIFVIFFLLIFIASMMSAGVMEVYNPYVWNYLKWYTVVGIAGVGIQVYMLLLLRSKLCKLNYNGQFQFVNHAAEAECTMVIEETVWHDPEREIDELENIGSSDQNK